MAFAVSSLLRIRRRRFRHGGSGMLLANPYPKPVRRMTSIVISLVSSGTLLAPWEKQWEFSGACYTGRSMRSFFLFRRQSGNQVMYDDRKAIINIGRGLYYAVKLRITLAAAEGRGRTAKANF